MATIYADDYRDDFDRSARVEGGEMKPLNEWKIEWEGDENYVRINLLSQFTGEIRQLNCTLEELDILRNLYDWLKEGVTYEDGFGDQCTVVIDLDIGIREKIPEFYKDYLEGKC